MIEQNGLIQILKTMTKTEKKKVMKTNLITAILASDIVHDPMEGLTSFFPIFSFFFFVTCRVSALPFSNHEKKSDDEKK